MSPNLPWGSSAVVPVLTTPAPVSVDLPVTEEPVPLAIESLPANILDTREPQQRGHGMQLRHMTRGTGEQFYALIATGSLPDPTCYTQAVK